MLDASLRPADTGCMFAQIAIGAGLIVTTAVVAGLGFLAVEQVLTRRAGWLSTPPLVPKRLAILCASVLWFLCAVFVAIALWALVYLRLGLFESFEEATYFSIVCYTTLGFGDILLPDEWRLLSGLESLNGLLMIGLQAAMLIDVMTRIRRHQSAGVGD
ncbi:Kef-type K+ transporter [Candidatus Rhodobacter oscarellae]|uniref:Kef-type K+ transporter n=1 Tax=Candidatus Rhodobacter oscarellae TaxID=1675527 RepID=A0A0J9EA34_9RHOB|nr:potassium channel family protein [Candidatus Rhodobacter lobularis]KMW59635.1 Kef-type K+ transporter [Candidatus Rhodobacter lobularis]